MKEAKPRQRTREELVIEASKLRDSHAGWVSGDENRRIEFAKAFSWFKKKNAYDYQEEYHTPTWVEIFIHLGRLLKTRDLANVEQNLGELELRLDGLEDK